MYLSGYECIIEHCRSLGMFAYEDAVNGILVKYLQKFIVQDKSVIEIFSQVQEGESLFQLLISAFFSIVTLIKFDWKLTILKSAIYPL